MVITLEMKQIERLKETQDIIKNFKKIKIIKNQEKNLNFKNYN